MRGIPAAGVLTDCSFCFPQGRAGIDGKRGLPGKDVRTISAYRAFGCAGVINISLVFFSGGGRTKRGRRQKGPPRVSQTTKKKYELGFPLDIHALLSFQGEKGNTGANVSKVENYDVKRSKKLSLAVQ